MIGRRYLLGLLAGLPFLGARRAAAAPSTQVFRSPGGLTTEVIGCGGGGWFSGATITVGARGSGGRACPPVRQGFYEFD